MNHLQKTRRDPDEFEQEILDFINKQSHPMTPAEIAEHWGHSLEAYSAIAFLTMNFYVNTKSGYIWKVG